MAAPRGREVPGQCAPGVLRLPGLRWLSFWILTPVLTCNINCRRAGHNPIRLIRKCTCRISIDRAHQRSCQLLPANAVVCELQVKVTRFTERRTAQGNTLASGFGCKHVWIGYNFTNAALWHGRNNGNADSFPFYTRIWFGSCSANSNNDCRRYLFQGRKGKNTGLPF